MNWMKYRLVYFLISITLVGGGVFGILKWGLNLGIEFTGGINAEYKSPEGLVLSVKEGIKDEEEIDRIRQNYKKDGYEEIRFETVGPSIGPELIKKTIYAIVLSTLVILVWIAVQFKNVKFGLSAVLAMLHDTLILVGSFAYLGHFMSVEIDFLFVTAVLTILSFSVHDTIVVFDRIREKQRMSSYSSDLYLTANNALTETMVRSLNNSFTIIFMLLSLIIIGGDTVRWFSVALLIGTVSGTYSSPFVAVPLLVTWDAWSRRQNKK